MQLSPVNIKERQKFDIRAGDTVRVWQKIEEKGKTRLQAFEGLVVSRKHGTEPGATITVRKIASGVGMEKIFPLYSPVVDKIEIVRRARVRRSKLYYIREKSAKNIRRKMKVLSEFVPVAYEEAPPEEEGEEAAEAAKAAVAKDGEEKKTSKTSDDTDAESEKAPSDGETESATKEEAKTTGEAEPDKAKAPAAKAANEPEKKEKPAEEKKS